MAENKVTVQEAVDLITNNKLEFSDEQLAQMNEAFFEDFTNNPSNDVKDARDIALGLAEERITALAAQDSYDAADLDSIMALAGSISAFSREADVAKEVLAKAQKQKEELAATAPENEGQEDTSEFEVGEADAGDAEANEEHVEDVSVNEGAEAPTPENQHDTAEPETSAGTEEAEEQLEEAENIPEDQAELEAFDKEYGIDTMTAEQLEKNAEVMDASEFNPFELNEEEKLVHPEFQAEYDAIQNLEITDDNGEPLSEEEQKKAKENLVETAVFEAGMLTRGTAKGDEEAIKAQYVSNLKSSMQKAVVSTAFASEIEGKPLNRETYGTAFAKVASQEGGLRTGLKNIMAYAGVVNGEMTKLKDRLQNKFKEIPAVQKMSAKIAAFDKSMSEKHPKMWKTAKRVGGILAKRVKGIAVYTAVGATAGPIGLAALAVKSGYDSYKGLSEKAKKEGMTLGQYAKTHKMEVGLAFTTSALSMAGSALGLGAGGSELAQTVSPYLKTATRALAIGPKAAKAAFHGLKAAAIKMGWKKGNVQEELAAAKAALNQTVDATIGMVAGSYLNEGLQSAHAAMDKDGDGTLDIFDADHGEGWATANEQQLDGLMNDAESVNAILGEGHNHTPEELREMLSKGEFTDEQLKDIHELAAKGFDKEGAVIDNDKDGVADYKDVDHGEGWSATDKQLDGLMNDAESVNAILGEGHNHTPEELREMLSKGEFTDEQLKSIHELATKGFDKEGAAIDKDNDGVADYKDVDHGEGWAKANETQLDRLMDADARGVNAVLNDGKWHSSAELKDMMAKGENVEGGFTTEQLKAIHELATREFDQDGHIIDKDLNKLYENLARQAAAKAEPQETPDENKGQETPANDEKAPAEVEKTPAEQKMYESILATISKGEDMNNPEVKASVEALAQQYFNNVKGALEAGNEQAAVDLLHNLHKQGEAAEVREATQREDDDSRGVRHAKEDLAKISGKLDEAKAALAADPNNEKLQKEVEKLEKEFDKKSLNLDNKEIKQERSELKDQINRDNKSADNLDWTREQIEKNLGISQEAADKQLAAAGFDLNNLPKDTENLPEDVQKLINAHNQYAQVDQTEAALRGRVAENEQAREDLKAQEKENKEAMKDVKKGHGFSTDDAKRASIEDRLPGQSDFRDSEMASSLVGMARGGNEAATQEQEKVESNEEIVDRFLKDQVAKGNMTEAEAQEQREALIATANAQESTQGKEGQGQESTAEEKTENHETQEPVAKPYVAETKAGSVVYHVNEQGNYIYTMPQDQDIQKDAETYNALKEELSKSAPRGASETERKLFVETQARTAYTADAINRDIDARLARGEEVPNAEKMKAFNNTTLKQLGLEYDKNGHLHSSNANAGNVQMRGNGRE